MAGTTVSQRNLLNPRAMEGRATLGRHPPSDDLAFFIERYWIARWDLRGREPFEQQALPQPCVNLVVEAGRTAIHGVATRRSSVLLEGRGQAVGVKFRPGAFHPILGRPVATLNDRTISPRDVLGVDERAIDELEARVLSTEDDAAQIAAIEAFLRDRLPRPPHDPNVEAAVRVVQVALASRELTKVDDLAARVDRSTRSLERLFHRYVGVTPKWLLRMLRLHEAAALVADGKAVDWAALAGELGYFDQAHFIRDFKAHIGRSPTEYAALCAPAG